MKIQTCNFLIHPLHRGHSSVVKVLAIITRVALAILSAGLFLLVLTLGKREVKKVVSKPVALPSKLQHLKEKQASHLAKLERLEWKHLQQHTTHPDSGFDWWMFPVDRPSQGQGDRYQVSAEEIGALKADPAFMASYRRGVILVAKSWGWDIENSLDVTNDVQKWSFYDVRLGKMLNSLILFQQWDLHERLVNFIEFYELRDTLALWVIGYLQQPQI